MVFSSLFFIYFFLPLCMICCLFCNTIHSKNIVLLIFSLIFYAWGEPVYVLLLVGMAFSCWLFSRLIDTENDDRKRKIYLFISSAICIAAIGYFKYAGFLVENLNSLCHAEVIPVPTVALPIGISFYTFQLLTYVVDVYRREVPSQQKFWRVLLYAGLFHQCIAGPIVRYGDIENELTQRNTSDISNIERGISRFIMGLGKKAIFANGCGAVVDAMMLSDAEIGNAAMLAENIATLGSRSAFTLWAGMAFYMMQIYLDFSAYSDMAIGMGLMCGFHYKENFDYPYLSLSVTEFWRRWHMSLGTFFRDYVYIPLGGNRKGTKRQIFNMFVVWALTGLWHGASWNFVLWGIYFFILLVLEKVFIGEWLKTHRVVARLYLLAVVFFGWILFRYTDMSLVGTVLKGMFGLNHNGFWSYESRKFLLGYFRFFILAVLACTPLWKNLGRSIRRGSGKNQLTINLFRVGDVVFYLVILILASLSLVGDTYNPFLYFQF